MRDLLYEAGRTLLGPIESSADFYPFLGLVQDARRELVEVVVAERTSSSSTTRRDTRLGAEPSRTAGRISLGSYLGAAVDSRRDQSAQVKVGGGARGPGVSW
jgi:hypothetical protein